MSKRFLYIFTLAALLALLAAAMICRALAAPAIEITPEPPRVASYRPTVIPRAPEVVATEPSEVTSFDEALVAALAGIDAELAERCGRLIWGEAGGVLDGNNRAAALWCALNRADVWGESLDDVLNVGAFHGLAVRGEVPERFVDEAAEILALHEMEAEGWKVTRLPLRFLYFEAAADGSRNIFSTEFGGGEYWDGQEGF